MPSVCGSIPGRTVSASVRFLRFITRALMALCSPACVSGVTPADMQSPADGPESGWRRAGLGGETSIWGSGANDVFIVGGFDVLRSRDMGGTWTGLNLPIARNGAYQLQAVYTTSPSNVLVVGNFGTLLRSSDDGDTWVTVRSPPGLADQTLSLYGIWGDGTNVFAVGDLATIFHSGDGGQTWEEQSIPNNLADCCPPVLHGVWGNDRGDVWVAGGDGDQAAILHTNDGGKTWTYELHADHLAELQGIWGSGDERWAVGSTDVGPDSTGVILHSSGGQDQWTQQYSAVPANGLYAVWGSGPDDVYAVGAHEIILHTSDRGMSWTLSGQGHSATYAFTNPTFLSVWGSGPNDVYVVGSGYS